MHDHPAKHLLDIGSAAVAAGAFAGALPSVAAAFSIIWYGLRFYEWAEIRFGWRKPPEDSRD